MEKASDKEGKLGGWVYSDQLSLEYYDALGSCSSCLFIHSFIYFIHLFIQQIIIEYILCAKHWCVDNERIYVVIVLMKCIM